MPNITPISAVLFDLDGTLVETHIDFPAMTRAMDDMARAAGVPADVYQGRDILGVVYASTEWLNANGLDAVRYSAEAFAALEELEVRGCNHPTAIPHAASTLAELRRRGIGVGIVTRNCRRVASTLVSEFDLTHDVLLTRDDVPRTKPDPDHLHRALDRLHATPDKSMMVGDHWMDIHAGIEAGCRITIGFLHGRTPEHFDRCPPTHLAKSIAEILDWL
jgi:phosphoglycolate phosphatase